MANVRRRIALLHPKLETSEGGKVLVDSVIARRARRVRRARENKGRIIIRRGNKKAAVEE